MKIAVTGKGGVGKTTFAATLADYMQMKGKRSLQLMLTRTQTWDWLLDLMRRL